MRRVQKRCIFKRKIQHSEFLLQKGDVGIFSLESYRVTKRQLECCRLLLRRELKKKGSVLLRLGVSIPITNKSTGVRMGKGKGDVDFHVGFLNKNDLFIEIKGVSYLLGLKLLKKISYKLPFRVGLYTKGGNTYFLK
jgi:large subunit ribosomal protein L16